MTTAATEILTELKELWETAEVAPFGADDALIIRYGTGEYTVRPRAGYDSEGEKLDHMRILERAKPKAPEWEAVVASNLRDKEHVREAYVRTEAGSWESPTYFLSADELVDPVPLVELPSRGELADAVEKPYYAQGGWSWPGSYPLADAVLELLRGER